MKTHDYDSPELDDPRVVEALDEYLAALETGQKPDRQEFLSRHAAIADALAECLDMMEALHQASPAPQPPAGGGAAPADWQPGTPLGDYRLVREIGRGGMGVVYEAEQLSLGRRIALKVLPFALTLDPRQLQRFKNEARAAAQLHHQHIVPVYAVGSERGVHFYAMQYIEGQSLAEVIHDLRSTVSRDPKGSASALASGSRRNELPVDATGTYVPQSQAVSGAASASRVPPTQATRARGAGATPLATSYSADSNGFYRSVARLGIQAAEALEHAHEYGVIHRDIKPGNLMVDAHGHLWVTDFGLAQFQTEASLTQSGHLLGTLRYMSPEQASGQRLAVDHRTDIYSLGATLYEMLTLHPPFEGNSQHALLQQISNEEPCPPRGYQKSIPVELETIVLKALAKAPAERYATARELADDLSRFLQDQPIRARRATAAQRLRKWARRHPSFVWSFVLFCLLTAAGSLVSATMIHAAYERERQRKQEAEERKQEAEDQFRLAREAVDGMFQLFEEELANKPFLDGLRRRLLQDYFLVYYQKLIDQRRDDPAAQAELSATRERVQEILNNLADLQGMGQYHLLNNPDVVDDLLGINREQRLLGINREQREQIRQLTENMEARRWESRRLSPEQRRQHFLEDARWMESEAQSILNKEQRRRLRQIDLQFKGGRAFEEPDIIEALHLDASQRERIRAIQAQDVCDAFGDCHPGPPDKRGGPPPGGRRKPSPSFPRGAREREGTEPPFDPVAQIEKDVLTKEQQQKWRERIGQPFKKFGRRPHGPHGP
ncbi:MAG TPA: protein kinase [Gemmataceae bacterium]|nr:protein kinase [Gemmataceae bacterium]